MLIFKASGVFNFAQGIMVVFAALALVVADRNGMPAWIALILTSALWACWPSASNGWSCDPCQAARAILLMATIGLTLFLQGVGETIFGGEPKAMITEELGLPTGATDWSPSRAGA